VQPSIWSKVARSYAVLGQLYRANGGYLAILLQLIHLSRLSLCFREEIKQAKTTKKTASRYLLVISDTAFA
jgi:hypothetical protein